MAGRKCYEYSVTNGWHKTPHSAMIRITSMISVSHAAERATIAGLKQDYAELSAAVEKERKELARLRAAESTLQQAGNIAQAAATDWAEVRKAMEAKHAKALTSLDGAVKKAEAELAQERKRATGGHSAGQSGSPIYRRGGRGEILNLEVDGTGRAV